MDEPASALDPIATHAHRGPDARAEAATTRSSIVTHNMQQAARVADMTAFFSITSGEEGNARRARRVRRHEDDLHAAEGQANRGLRDRPLRLSRSRRLAIFQRSGGEVAKSW